MNLCLDPPSARHRCTHCGHLTKPGWFGSIADESGVQVYYCAHRAACRRAQHEAYGQPLSVAAPSDEALGAAVIAADYVEWPAWAWLLPRGLRDALRSAFARPLAAAVEDSTRRRLTGVGDV